MLTDRVDDLIRAAFAPAGVLEPSEVEIAEVLARAGSASGRPKVAAPAIRRRPAAVALAALLLLAAALYSVPTTRAAIEEAGGAVGGVFSAWLGGDPADAPGRPVEAGESAPGYLYDHDYAKDPRVIASAGGYDLYAYREPSGGIGFDLGDTGVGLGYENVAELGSEPLHVLGPGALRLADAAGHVPLFGIAAREVTAVELTYASGPPLKTEGVEGGFVLLAEPDREPREVLALDGHGEILGRRPVREIEWRDYVHQRPTVSSRTLPSRPSVRPVPRRPRPAG